MAGVLLFLFSGVFIIYVSLAGEELSGFERGTLWIVSAALLYLAARDGRDLVRRNRGGRVS
ncbi:MAG: hypothetical protein KDD44_05145 [Bdellovibrionales bacterium]|nr:hypothetical protein [Bdellovibrionales bacterium]